MWEYIVQASSFAGKIDTVILVVTVLTGIGLVAAEGVLFYLIFKYRKNDTRKGEYITGEEKHQKKWIAIPHKIILVADIAVIVIAVQAWYHVKQHLPKPERTIRVIGQQWAWTFVHPGEDGEIDTEDDVALVDELHVEKDVLYHFKLESKDVLHSFFIPVFRLKQDAIPGREFTGWFKPTKTGEYDVSCAEMCGVGHGIMGARVFIRDGSDHSDWLATQKG